MTRKPWSHVRILIYGTWAIGIHKTEKQHREKASSLFADVFFTIFILFKSSVTAQARQVCEKDFAHP